MSNNNEITQEEVDELCEIFINEYTVDERLYKLDLLLGENINTEC